MTIICPKGVRNREVSRYIQLKESISPESNILNELLYYNIGTCLICLYSVITGQ